LVFIGVLVLPIPSENFARRGKKIAETFLQKATKRTKILFCLSLKDLCCLRLPRRSLSTRRSHARRLVGAGGFTSVSCASDKLKDPGHRRKVTVASLEQIEVPVSHTLYV
jgi:hypothetical protein